MTGFVRRAKSLTFGLRKHWILVSGYLITLCYSLNRGSDTNFDLRNIRAFNAWMIVRGRLGDDPTSNFLTRYLPLHDVANVILMGTGRWWLPVIFWAGVHASIVVISYQLVGQLLPTMPNLQKQLLAAVSLASPLIMMQVGTSFGDLTAAPFLGLMIVCCLKKSSDWNWWLAGSCLALAAVMKPTMLLSAPAIIVGVGFLSSSIVQVVTLVVGFVGVYSVLALIWTSYWSLTAHQTFLSIPGLPFSGLPFVLLTLGVVGFLSVSFTGAGAHWLLTMHQKSAKPVALGIFRAALVCATLYQGKKWHDQFLISGDQEWLVRSTSDFFRRLSHVGSLVDGYRPLDLEIAYRDYRVAAASVALGLAVVMLLSRLSSRRRKRSMAVVGATFTVTIPIIFMIYILGYARYFVQFLPFVPIVLIATVHELMSSSRRVKEQTGVSLVFVLGIVLSVAALVPLNGGSPYVKRFAQTGAKGNLLSREEAQMLNALIPKGSTVHVSGVLISSAAVILNRPDVVWTYASPPADELRRNHRLLLYSPPRTKTVDAMRQSGVRTQNCVVLRFKYSTYGVCDLMS